jgi:hypothetical protein
VCVVCVSKEVEGIVAQCIDVEGAIRKDLE